MEIALAVDDSTLQRARQRAIQMGTSVDDLVRAYLERLADVPSPELQAEQFELLSRTSGGDSRGWTFRREDAYEGR